jgi:hypothetical protein
MDTYLAEALRLAQELNDRQGLVLMLLRLARAEDARGDRARAVTLAGRALTIAREAGDRLGFARAMEQLAALAAADQPERGVSLAAAAASLRQTLGADLPPAERERLTGWQVTARRTLGETAYAAAMEQGGSQTLEQAFTLAQDLAQAAGAGLVTVSGPRGTASPNTWDLRL